MEGYEILKIVQPVIHYGLHFVFPGILAWVFFRNKWKDAWLIMIATMAVDLDHLFSSPIFDPNRCSIDTHFLHTHWAILIYFLMLFIPKTRIIAVGLLFHMLTDFIDCNLIYLI